MPRQQIIPRRQDVEITDHAFYERWPERAGIPVKKCRLIRTLEARLTALAQGDGIRLDKTGAGQVEVYPWLYAKVRLTDRCWLVMTFIARDGGWLGEST